MISITYAICAVVCQSVIHAADDLVNIDNMYVNISHISLLRSHNK